MKTEPHVEQLKDQDGYWTRTYISGYRSWECKTEEDFLAYIRDVCDELYETTVKSMLPRWRRMHSREEGGQGGGSDEA